MEKQTKDDAYYESLDKRTNEYKEWDAKRNQVKPEDKIKKATPEQDAKHKEMLSHAKEQESVTDHSNPFNEGVTYKSFLKELGSKDLEKHLQGKKCTKEQIDWIKRELKDFNNIKK